MTAPAAKPTPDEPRVTIESPAGRLTGLDRGATQVFKGIRFAAAARFEPPIDVERWQGTLEADTYRAQAPQNFGQLEQLLGGSSLPTDEDCLHLNVFTPACDGARRPVLFWVHGGAYVTGGGAMPWYDGSRLAVRGDVVVVTINYRLGALGFLGELNAGTLDQVSALRWVARNIEAFGGDPGNVTIFGESAGGSAVISLMAAPGAEHLFRRVWAMSPSILQLRTRDEAEGFQAEYLRRLGVATVDELRHTAIEELLAAQTAMLTRAAAGLQEFAPADGTASLPEPILAVAADDARPLVIGTTRDEMNLFTVFDPTRADFDDDRLRREFARRFGETALDQAIDRYRRHRPGLDANLVTAAMQTDEVFRAPAWSLSTARARAGRPTWMYTFDQATPALGGRLGACHGLDIPFAFDNLARPGVELFTGDAPSRQAVADQFADAIVAFARSGSPGWPGYDLARRATQRIGPEPEVIDDPEPELRELWEAEALTSR